MPETPIDRQCRIEQTLGRTEPCIEQGCPFWETAKATGAGDCIFDRIDFTGREHLASWLHDLRSELERTGRASTDAERQHFYERLNAARGD